MDTPNIEMQAVPPKPALPKSTWKEKIKRAALVAAGLYALLLLMVTLWGAFLSTKPLGFFSALPFSQAAFNGFTFTVFLYQMGGIIAGLFLLALFYALWSLWIKEPVEKKRRSHRALLFGAGFLLTTIVWLILILVLGPKWNPEQRFSSPIVTTPQETIGLTAPVEITFDASSLPIDLTKYEVLSYAWNFGDGSTATGLKVAHRYTQKGADNGRYTVILDVDYMDLKTGEQFNARFTKEVSISNESTSAVFTAAPSSGELPLKVTFDASASFDPDGEIVSYEWDFNGDGRFDDAEGPLVSYEFTQEGTFEISLRVTDNNGGFNVSSSTIEAGTVNGLRAVVTSKDVPTGASYLVGEEYAFSAENSRIASGAITRFEWNFGDNTKTQGRNVTHTFEKPGPYEIALSIQDANGNTDIAYFPITVIDLGTAPVPVLTTNPAMIGGKVTGPFPLKVSFDASGSLDVEKDIVDYQWDFTDDSFVDANGAKAEFTFDEEGLYQVRLILTDSAGNKAEEIIPVEVTPQGVVARLDIDTTNGPVPLTVRFNASGSSYKEGNIVSYEYDFGDGGQPFVGGSEVTYRYNSIGTFTATLTVVADDGKRDTAQVQIVVRPVALSACFTVNSDRGNAPFFLSVNSSCSQGTIASYEWNFGDGSISFDRAPEVHMYNTPGVYTVRLEVTSDRGIVESFEKTIRVD